VTRGAQRPPGNRLLTVRQAAQFLGVTPAEFKHSPAYETIPVTPKRASAAAPAVPMYRVADLEAWLDAHRPTESADPRAAGGRSDRRESQ